MTDAQTNALMVWLGGGGLVAVVCMLAFVALASDKATRHSHGRVGMARDYLLVIVPLFPILGLLILRGVLDLASWSFWPLPLLVVMMGAVLWPRVPAVRNAAQRLVAVNRRSFR